MVSNMKETSQATANKHGSLEPQKGKRNTFALMTVCYLSALTLVALLSTGGYYLVNTLVKKEATRSTLINIAGRQRRLCLTIAFDCLNLTSLKSDKERQSCRKRLLQSTSLMQQCHDALTKLSGEFGLPKTMSKEISDIYFAPPHNLNANVQRYLEISKRIAASSDSQLVLTNPDIQYVINEGHGHLLGELDFTVHQYETDAKLQIEKIEQLELASLTLILIVLSCEAAFIFFPMSRKVQNQVDELAEFFENAVVALHWVGPDGTILRVNKAELDLLGYSAEEVIGRHISEFHADQLAIKEILARLSRNEPLNNFSAKLRCKDGSIKEVVIDSNVYCNKGMFVHTRCFTRDVSQLKKIESELREKEFRTRVLVDTAPAGIITFDADGVIESANLFSASIFGWQTEDLIGQKLSSLIPNFFDDKAKYATFSKFTTGQSQIFEGSTETIGISKDGAAVPIEFTWSVLNLGERTVFTIVVQNISERKEAQEQLERSESRFRQMAENIREIFWVTDARGANPIYVSPGYEEIFGRTVKSLFENPHQFFDVTHPDDRESLANVIRKQREDKNYSNQIEYRIMRPDGEVRWLWARLCSVVDKNGKVTELCGVTNDITERKAAEKDLLKSERLFKAIFDHTFELIGLLTAEGTLLQANETALRLAGIKSDDVVGLPFWDTPWWSHSTAAQNQIKEAVKEAAAGKMVRFETSHVNTDGALVFVDFSLKPVVDEAGNVSLLIPEGRDITEKKEAEKRVNEFYSVVSHELRTPITSIRGALKLLEGGMAGELSERATLLVQIGSTESERLIRLINDLLDIKKIEVGKLELNCIVLDPVEIAEKAVEALAPMAAESEVQLLASIASSSSISADRDRITQVLTNLLSNAIKFSTAGAQVLLKLELVGAAVRFSVIDHGPGIPKSQMSKLFGMFQQLDSSDDRPKGGTGLGLAISKAIIERHGGSIGVDSEIGKGATFWFELPVVTEQRAQDLQQKEPAQKLYPALVIDDDENLCKILQMSLEKHGFDLRTASTLEQAEQLLEAFRPRVILLDLHLPDGHGFEFLQKLRQSPATERIPIVVISGSEPKEDKFSFPFVIDFLEKPFEQNDLQRALTVALGRHVATSTKVLVVEDDIATRKILIEKLRVFNVECKDVGDGREALDAIMTEHFDLVILDLGLPTIDGVDLIKILKAKGKATLPLLIYTARDLTNEEKKELALGLTRHLTKGKSSEEEFLTVIQEMLNTLIDTEMD